jgi:hypothetical protein
MITEVTNKFSSVYSSWIGKPVVMLVAIRQCLFPMPCRIVSESAAGVRVWLERGWEVDVRKEMILAVEEVVMENENMVN